MHQTEHCITFVHRVHDDTHCIYIINLVKVASLHIDLAVDAVDALDTALQEKLHVFLFQPVPNLLLDVRQEVFALLFFELEQPLDLLIGDRVQKPQRNVLQLLLDRPDTQSVCQRRIYLHRFQRFFTALVFLPVFAGAHIVQPVGKLDDDNAHILCHGKQHLAHVFSLALLFGGIAELGQLGDTVYHQGNIRAKQPFDVVKGGGGVLHHVVQKSCADRFGIHTQFQQNLCDCDRVGDIGIS